MPDMIRLLLCKMSVRILASTFGFIPITYNLISILHHILNLFHLNDCPYSDTLLQTMKYLDERFSCLLILYFKFKIYNLLYYSYFATSYPIFTLLLQQSLPQDIISFQF